MAQQERTGSSGGREHVQDREEDVGQRRGPVLPPHTEDHGHSTAAWTGVGIVMLGSLVASFGVALLMWWMFWVGIGIALLGPLVGRVLSAKGYGAVKVEQQSSDHPRDAPHNSGSQGTQKPGAQQAGGSGPDAGTDTSAGTR